jgi:hypothetical protein
MCHLVAIPPNLVKKIISDVCNNYIILDVKKGVKKVTKYVNELARECYLNCQNRIEITLDKASILKK